MKILAGLLFLLMLAFAAVQWNDPDGPLWAAIYAVPAVLMLVVVLRSSLLSSVAGKLIVGFIVLALLIATVLAWPQQDAFWTRDVWWEEETAREGMGLLIALLVSCVAIPAALVRRRV